MPAFDISFMRVDRDEDPTIVESFFRTVDWPVLPREGEGSAAQAGWRVRPLPFGRPWPAVLLRPSERTHDVKSWGGPTDY